MNILYILLGASLAFNVIQSFIWFFTIYALNKRKSSPDA